MASGVAALRRMISHLIAVAATTKQRPSHEPHPAATPLLHDPRLSPGRRFHPGQRRLRRHRGRPGDASLRRPAARRPPAGRRVHPGSIDLRRTRRPHRPLASDLVAARSRARFAGRRDLIRCRPGRAGLRGRHVGALGRHDPGLLRVLRSLAAGPLQRDRRIAGRRRRQGQVLRGHADPDQRAAHGAAGLGGLGSEARPRPAGRRVVSAGRRTARLHAALRALGNAHGQQDAAHPEVLAGGASSPMQSLAGHHLGGHRAIQRAARQARFGVVQVLVQLRGGGEGLEHRLERRCR